jgi:two-component system phosphate regulon response regulator OmpR
MSLAPNTLCHLLVVDDDARIRQMLVSYFEGEGYHVTAVPDGVAMRATLAKSQFDIILLDLVLPGDDGLSLAREIRSTSDVPIVMLTGRGDVIDRIVGLEIGADDYIAKPFHLREVLARVRSILRRRQTSTTSPAKPDDRILEFEGLTLDLGRRRLLDEAQAEIELTTGEFEMLAVLAAHPGRVFERETLMDMTRGRNLDAFDRTIDAQIARLRKKIERDPSKPELVKSVRGIGYVFAGKEKGPRYP